MMQCPKCQFHGPDDLKFCGNCGARLELTCSNCHNTIPPAFNFCGHCGHAVQATANLQSRNRSLIRRLLPESLSAKAWAQKDRLEGERKRVSVMVCDMEGYTALSEQIGPEDAFSLMERVYAILIQKVYDFEGTVNELTGDGIMAFFGAPVALEDAPQRAIRSALAIHREMARFCDVLNTEQSGIPGLRMRIGIHTGLVVVGSLGSDLRVEFKAVGDTVNLAARLEGIAKPGTTYVSEETFKLAEGLFRFEALGMKKVKGRAKAVGVYRVIAPSSSRTRFDVSAERGLTPLVGRDRELELLRDAFERSREGLGQAFSIIAEAGVGKSRLLYEFRKTTASENVTFLEGRCLSYDRASAYHPVIDILKSNFDIRDSDSQSQIKQKIEHGLEALKCDVASTAPYIMELFGIRDDSRDALPVSPEVRKHRTHAALSHIAQSGSELRPLVLAFEDLHWIDRSSEEYLKHLIASIPAARVLLILTYRPEFTLTWGARSYHGQVNLNRLSNRESLNMVKHILNIADLDPNLEDLILQKTEGIPLFVEEFTKSLRDLNLLKISGGKYFLAGRVQELKIPATIQDVIMARVDTLPEDAREIIRIGSVIEREFGYPLIKMLSRLEERELIAGLSVLKDSELLYERGIFPLASYIFKHPLTREVVYDSILTKKRQMLHGRVGKAIETIYAGSLHEHYGALSGHFIASGDYERGAKYSELAAKKANKAGAYLDAVEYAKRKVGCYEESGDSITSTRLIDARTTVAGYYLLFSDLINARDAVAPIVEAISPEEYQEWLPGIHTTLGLYHLWVEEDFGKGLHYLENAREVSQITKQRAWHWFASYYLGAYMSWNCEYKRSVNYLRASVQISSAANDHQGIVTAKSTLAFCHALASEIHLAYSISEESLKMARETDNPNANLVAILCHGLSCYFRGYPDAAESILREGLNWHDKVPQNIWCMINCAFLGDVHCQLGQPEEALRHYELGTSFLTSTGLVPSWLSIIKVSMARAEVLAGRKEKPLDYLAKHHNNNKFKILTGWTARNIAEILLTAGSIRQAEEWLNKAMEEDRRNSAWWYLGQDHTLYAEIYKRKSDPVAARVHFNKAIQIFKDCGASGFQENAEQELASI